MAELIETNYRRAIILEKTIPNLLLSFFKHPISIVLVLIIAFMFLSQSKWYKAWRDRKSK